MKKPKIAIFDLTDCEGCELQFIALREKLLLAGHDFEIVNWRLGSEPGSEGPFDLSFIEGSPISESDIEIVKQARKVSEKIVTLGTCAALGGVQSSLPEASRGSNIADIYGSNYKTSSKAPKPVSYYIDVDIQLLGCPVNPAELERLLASVFAGKKFVPKHAPVCLECKVKGNPCLFLDEGFCLGPVTQGGCGAPCPSAGLRCYGCMGLVADANLEALRQATKEELSDKEFDNALKLFLRHTPKYKDYQSKPKGKK